MRCFLRDVSKSGQCILQVGEIPHDSSSDVTEIQIPGVRLSHAHVFDSFLVEVDTVVSRSRVIDDNFYLFYKYII